MERTPEQIRRHYELEKLLAARLRNAPAHERKTLAPKLYAQLYDSIPDHPRHSLKNRAEIRRKQVSRELRYLRPWLTPATVFLEIGAGDCLLSRAVAPLVGKAIALDIVDVAGEQPKNFDLVLSDGVNVPVQDVTLAYSNQLMEHIHPDDALTQLDNIYDALVPGGAYICTTPNRLCGPHDVSRHFDKVATCFHLKEYTIRELAKIFAQRFSRVTWVPKSGVEVPISAAALYELACSMLPKPVRMKVPLPLRLVGYK